MTDPFDDPGRCLLSALMAGPVAGEALAERLGVTRAAVWKRIQALRQAGVEIDARPGRGYALPEAVRALGLLDRERILAALAPATRRRLGALEVAWSVDSTSSQLLRRPVAAAPEALLAERQSGGRGRRGRAWSSPLGAGIALSLQRSFDGPLARLGGLSLAVGIAVAQALHRLGLPAVGLKWPNDLVVERAGRLHKLGGILVEFRGEAGSPVGAVIGVGVNGRMPAAAAAAIDQPWIDVSTLAGGAPPARNALAAALLDALLPALDAFEACGLAPLLPDYAALDVLRGREVVLDTGAQRIRGTAAGVAADGGLRVRGADGERSWHAGEVSVRPATA